MKAEEIVNQLLVKLPQLTDRFTNDVSVAGITRSSTTMTATCNAPHMLLVGQPVVITGAIAPIPISSLTRLATVGTLVTSTVHDLTDPIAPTVTLSGSTEAEFNGTFTRLQVKNRKTVTFTMADSGATTATGSPIIENAESDLRTYTETVQVTGTPTETRFTYENSVTSLPNPVGTIVARTGPRISAAVTFDRAAAAYTEQSTNDFWLFVVLETVAASKSRRVAADNINDIKRGNHFEQKIIQPFTLYVFANVVDELLARQGRDAMEDIFSPICQSVLHHAFDSGLHIGSSQHTAQFVQHGVVRYDTAVLIYAFEFQQTVELLFEDTVGHDLDVAFRDIDFSVFPDPDQLTETISFMRGTPDLDDEPL